MVLNYAPIATVVRTTLQNMGAQATLVSMPDSDPTQSGDVGEWVAAACSTSDAARKIWNTGRAYTAGTLTNVYYIEVDTTVVNVPDEEVTETTPGSGIFTLDNAVPAGATLYASYTQPTTEVSVTALRDIYDTSQVDGNFIKQGDEIAYLAASGLSVTPKKNDRLVIGSQNWTVVRVETVHPGSTNILYKLQIRGGA